jgi:hypothetical protein
MKEEGVAEFGSRYSNAGRCELEAVAKCPGEQNSRW